MVTCRPLTLQDYPDACALYSALSTGASLAKGPMAEKAFAKLLQHDGTTLMGADTDGHIVSMATLHLLPNMTYNARPYGLVENVASLPAYKRQGFGRAVMEAVARTAWEAGAYKIMLLTGQANDAKGFYETLGYAADEKHGMILRQPQQG